MQTLEILERPRDTAPALSKHTQTVGPYRRWLAALWIVPIVIALAAGAAVLVASRQAPVYRSTATIAAVPGSAIREIEQVLRGIETLERRTVIATIARLPSTARIRAVAAGALGQSDSLAGYSAHSSVIPNTNLIRIEVEGPDPVQAASFANALGNATATEVQAMYRVIEMSMLTDAVPPALPAEPNLRRALVLAVVLGAFLGVAVTYGFVRLSDPRAVQA